LARLRTAEIVCRSKPALLDEVVGDIAGRNSLCGPGGKCSCTSEFFWIVYRG